jgi:hypothetical protein
VTRIAAMLAVAGPVEANPLWVIDVDSAMSVIRSDLPPIAAVMVQRRERSTGANS